MPSDKPYRVARPGRSPARRPPQRSGEPRLGARGLYPSTGGAGTAPDQAALLWMLNLSDGAHSLFDVAARSGLPFADVAHAADALVGAGLLEELSHD